MTQSSVRTEQSADPTTRAPRSYRWRVVDIVVASVLAVAVGVVFWAWGVAWSGIETPFKAIAPGVQAFPAAVWLVGGVLGGLVIRKPGAALYVELLAATVSALIGTQWGLSTLEAGLVQGLGAELVFAIFLYRGWKLPVAWLAGAGAGVAMVINDRIISYPGAGTAFTTIYSISGVVGGAVLAGTLAWLATRALAASGALHRFASGRKSRTLV
jgi:energy-coupling factor transport system substrate-specific component